MAGPTLMATIDVGAHSARMLIAQVRDDMSPEILESLEKPTPLGSDVFNKGRISDENINLLCEILRNFRQKMDEYGVTMCKAIVASSVREAQNAEILIERLEHATGIRVDLFEGIDGARLDYLTATRDLPPELGFKTRKTLVADIGIGVCQVSLYEKGELCFTQTIRVGTLRIQEELPSAGSGPGMTELMWPFMKRSFVELEHFSSSLSADCLVAMGSSARALARISGAAMTDGGRSARLPKAEFDRLYRVVASMSPEQTAREFGATPAMAEAVTPCCLILDYLFKLTGASEAVIPMTSTKDALLQDFINERLSGKDYFKPQILSVVRRLAEKYKCQDDYTRRVVKISEKLFRRLQPLHGLGERELLLLNIGARLHKSGLFINNRSSHKHSYYLIMNSDIPGINEVEQKIAALTARYHRKAMPRPAHIEYMSLRPEERGLVNKLSSILRLACALGEICGEGGFKLRMAEDEIVIRLTSTPDFLPGRKYFDEDTEFFRNVFARRVTLA